MSGQLILVATPIGNLADVSQRMVTTLETADLILAEDTRRTKQLLSAFNIRKPLQAYHAHNEYDLLPNIIDMLTAGKQIVLVCDAGLPLISDPGLPLVQAAITRQIAITAIPGPNAALTALQLSGFAATSFAFFGFPPRQKKQLEDFASQIAAWSATAIIYLSPHRGTTDLQVLLSHIGNRPVAFCRELTKQFEEVKRFEHLKDLHAYLTTQQPKGEWTLVIGPAVQPAADVSTLAMAKLAQHFVAKNVLGTKQAAQLVGQTLQQPWRPIYRLMLQWNLEQDATAKGVLPLD